MYFSIGPGDLYRVTEMSTLWPDPVRGNGAFYLGKGGNRYNGPGQVTVNCAEDPWVVICEIAYYQALTLRKAISGSRVNSMVFPFVSEHLFWVFRIDPLPPIIDLEHLSASTTFGFSPLVISNPGQDYLATQSISNDIRTYIPPLGSADPRPEGLSAPSVRTPRFGSYQPKQLALFVINRSGLLPYDQRSTLVAKMRLRIKFLASAPTIGPVNFHTTSIDWARPRFRLSPIPHEPSLSPIPALAGRPGGRPIALNRWIRLRICF